MCSSSSQTGFVMDSIPNDLIVESRCDTPPHCESQLPRKSFPQQFAHFPSLQGVRQVACPAGRGVMICPLYACLHAVMDYDRAWWVALALHMLIEVYRNGALGLVSHHHSEDGGANGALDPLLPCDHRGETGLMVFVRTGQRIHILIRFLSQLLLDVPDYELLHADRALLLFHPTLAQHELQRRMEGDPQFSRENAMTLSIFLIYHQDQELDDLIVGTVHSEHVLPVEEQLLPSFLRLAYAKIGDFLSHHILPYSLYIQSILSLFLDLIELNWKKRTENRFGQMGINGDQWGSMEINGGWWDKGQTGRNKNKNSDQPESNQRPKDNH